MESRETPRATPVMILKAFVLSIFMIVGFGAAFYAGYNSYPYVLAPCIFLEMSSSTCLVLISRYLRGRLFEWPNENNFRGSFWLGCVMLLLSVVGCLVFAITGFGKIKGFEYREYGLYVALGTCLLAVVSSSVLVYDAKYFWGVWQRVVGNAMPGRQMVLRS